MKVKKQKSGPPSNKNSVAVLHSGNGTGDIDQWSYSICQAWLVQRWITIRGTQLPTLQGRGWKWVLWQRSAAGKVTIGLTSEASKMRACRGDNG